MNLSGIFFYSTSLHPVDSSFVQNLFHGVTFLFDALGTTPLFVTHQIPPANSTSSFFFLFCKDYCSACGKRDALEYYHIDGSYKLCSQRCFRDFVQRRKFISNLTQQSIFSRKYPESGGAHHEKVGIPSDSHGQDLVCLT